MVPPATDSPADNPIERIATSVYPAFALLAGMQLDLFTSLKDGPLDAEKVASKIDANADKLKVLLYSLVVAGLLNVEGELFSNTDIADRYLVKDSPECIVDIHDLLSTMWNAAIKSSESIRTGMPQAKINYSSMSKDDLRQFFRGEHPYALESGRDLVKRFDFTSYSTLLDVGGGSGGTSIAVTEACPNIQATIMDLPLITPVAQYYINKANAGNRINVIATDVIHDPLPGSYDVAVMASFLQVLSAEDARNAIKNVSRVINPGGDIYIRGYGIIDDSRVSPQKNVEFNLVYINVYDECQAYTEEEHKDWLEDAGFGEFKRTILSDGSSIIKALKI